MILGYGSTGATGAPRSKMESQGVAENFSHLRDGREPTEWAVNMGKTKSQIVFG